MKAFKRIFHPFKGTTQCEDLQRGNWGESVCVGGNGSLNFSLTVVICKILTLDFLNFYTKWLPSSHLFIRQPLC